MRATVLVLCVMLILALNSLVAAQTQTVEIQVAPAQIVERAPCQWVTVHAEIAYSSVVDSSVQINGLAADAVFADDCGDLVAKIEFGKITAIVDPPEAEITLTGITTGDVAFAGSETVRVK